jgi:prephenate dehydratase
VIAFSSVTKQYGGQILDGHAKDAAVTKALAALRKRCSLFRVLGSYPRAAL